MKEFADLGRAIASVRYLLEKYGIEPAAVRMIFNVSDRTQAARLDSLFRRGLTIPTFTPDGQESSMPLTPGIDTRKFTLMGMEIRLESPLHEPLA